MLSQRKSIFALTRMMIAETMQKKENNMHLPPARILNKVAKDQLLKTRAGTLIFLMNQQQDEFLKEQDSKLEAAGVDGLVAEAYMALAPLYAEKEAIGRFLQKEANYSLAGILPELTTPEEVVRVAAMDLRLQAMQQHQLLAMIKRM